MFPIETISARMLDYYVGRNDALIIDLREEKAYAESHVRGAVNIPYETLENRKDLPMNKILVFYCDRGGKHGSRKRICQTGIQDTFGDRWVYGVPRQKSCEWRQVMKSCNFPVTMIR